VVLTRSTSTALSATRTRHALLQYDFLLPRGRKIGFSRLIMRTSERIGNAFTFLSLMASILVLPVNLYGSFDVTL
jgi:hypothetical protein